LEEELLLDDAKLLPRPGEPLADLRHALGDSHRGREV
jgi:hypothetical protein